MASRGGQSASSQARSLGLVIVAMKVTSSVLQFTLLSRFWPRCERLVTFRQLFVRGCLSHPVSNGPANWDGPRQAWRPRHACGGRHPVSPGKLLAQGGGIIYARSE